jgi:hypothetical protein
MSSIASTKIAKVRHRKRILIAIALIAIVSVTLVSYAGIAYVYNFNIELLRATAPSELKNGSQTQVGVIAHYNKMNNPYFRNHITLSLSGSGSLWASFPVSYPYVNGTQTLPQTTISTPSDAANLIIKIPNDAQSGSYKIIITGTNSIGQTSTVTYTFNVVSKEG